MLRQIGKPLGLILIVVVVIGVICLFSVSGGLRNLFGGGNDLQTRELEPGAEQGELGRMYTALDVDENGCPVETSSQFYRDETVYVGVDESSIPRGTSMFMRLYHEGQPVEDTPAIQADRDTFSCVWFEFQPEGASGFEPGEYDAELIVNGNPVDSISFEVAQAEAGGGLVPGTGGSDVELGNVYTSTEVDENGCPQNDVPEFFPEEPVYVSIDESFIPSGTEIFARLIHEGQVVEDTDAVVADRDMETCVWFVFEGAGSSFGLEPGSYDAEVYVNGRLADSIQFDVR